MSGGGRGPAPGWPTAPAQRPTPEPAPGPQPSWNSGTGGWNPVTRTWNSGTGENPAVKAVDEARRRRATVVHRFQMAGVCAGLTALCVVQSAGTMVADTKVDLVVDPVRFLGRALSLWDPSASFGQANDQTVGYLWPMGPFFVLGRFMHLPEWLVQRFWWALLMSVAFTGLVTLARRMNIGTNTSQLIAGVAFALCPRILSEIGTNSIEAWPTAMAPWVLVPLIPLAQGARMRRPIMLSALAVACAGGVNATAILATVPLPLIWLATLHPFHRRVRALITWFVAMLFATAWWLVPLLLLGKYAPPFLNYTETADVTTRITDGVTVLRGTSNWVAYLGNFFGPVWPAGDRLVTDPLLIVATLVVTGLGIIGLSLHGIPRRGFLISALVIGFALVSLGHVSEVPFTFGSIQRTFLNELGAPLRNVHKFDVILRLPLMLGLAHAVGMASRLGGVVRSTVRPMRQLLASGLVLAGAVAVGVAALPALAFQLAPYGGYTDVPQYWKDAASYLNTNAPPDRVLIVPGATFPTYTWGATGDEVAQPLLTSEWAVRNIIPLAPAGTIRLLDGFESSLESGQGSAGLADVLARSGVKYLLVRSDLDYGRTGAVRPITVNQALSHSPGLTFVRNFGPTVGGDTPFGVFLDNGLNVAVPALQLYKVDANVSPVALYNASDVTTVVGGPESLLDLSADKNLSAAPTILAGDLGKQTPPGPVVITDSLRRRDVSFGTLHDNTSETLGASDPFVIPAAAHDYLPSWGDSQLTVAQYSGISSITASSSQSEPTTIAGSRTEHQPYAAIDGDPSTSWRPATNQPLEGQYLDIELAKSQVIDRVHLVFDTNADTLPTKVTVSTGLESGTATGLAASELDVRLPGQVPTRSLRITINSVKGIAERFGAFGIAEINIPGLVTGRTLVTARPPDTSTPATVELAASPSIPACYFVGDTPSCNPSAARASEDGSLLDRTVTLPAAASYTPTLWAVPRSGQPLDDLLDHQAAQENGLGISPDVAASSSAVNEPAGRPGVVLDGNPNTVWSPSNQDSGPFLRLTFLSKRTVSGVQLVTPPGMAATRPGAIQVIGDSGTRAGLVNAQGMLTFDPPLTTLALTIIFTPPPPEQTFDPYTREQSDLPIGVGEVVVLPSVTGTNPVVDLDTPVDLPCGSGPTLSMGGQSIQTKLVGTRRDLLQQREMPAQLCDDSGPVTTPVKLTAGAQHIVATASPLAVASRLSLDPTTAPAPHATSSALRVDSWTGTIRQVAIGASANDRIIAVRENTNPGWQATVDGRTLTPIVLDGWEQGWVVPAGVAGEIVLKYTPDSTYRAGVLFGAALLVVLFVLAAWPAPRYGLHARGPDWAPARRTDRLAALAMGAAGLILVGGVGGALVAVAGLLLAFYRTLFPRPASATDYRSYLRSVQLWVPVALLAVGGWLSRTGYDEHTLFGPQLAALLCVSALWLSVVAQPASAARARRQRQKRALKGVPADRGQA
jgi:arabinofuranan 3-O-arabinosyltransferase